MFSIPSNLACQKKVGPTCVDVPLDDQLFQTLEYEDSSMDEKKEHVDLAELRQKLWWWLVG